MSTKRKRKMGSFLVVLLAFQALSLVGSERETQAAVLPADRGEAPQLAAYWPFDEGSGTSAADAAVDDAAANNATVGASWTANGVLGSALSFSGSNSAIIGNSPELNITGDLTVSLWFKLDQSLAAQTNAYPILYNNQDGAGLKGYTLYGNKAANTINFRVLNGIGSPGYVDAYFSASGLAIGQWYHVLGTYNGGEVKVYLDSELKDTRPFSGAVGATTTSYSIGNAFQGAIDEVRVYKWAMNEDEVVGIYKGIRNPWRSNAKLFQAPAASDIEWVDSVGPDYSLKYKNTEYLGNMSRVFAYYSVPSNIPAGQKVPAIVLIHGGGGEAYQQWAQQWASYGYAAIAIDLNGKQGQVAMPDGRPWDAGNFNTTDAEVLDTWHYHAVAAAIRAVSFLKSRPEVDAAEIGAMGISWGGFTLSNLMGVDNRLSLAVPVYGTGYLNENSLLQDAAGSMFSKSWVDHFDPHNYLANANMPTFWVTGNNDDYFPIDSFKKSSELLKGTVKTRIKTDMIHDYGEPWNNTPEIRKFVDSYFLAGTPLLKFTSLNDNGTTVTANYESSSAASSAKLVYTEDANWKENYGTANLHTKINWNETSAAVNAASGTLTASIPSTAKAYYLNAYDSAGSNLVSSKVAVRTAADPGGFIIANDEPAWGYVFGGTTNAWALLSNRGAGDYQNDVHATTANGDYFQFSFTGSGVDYITEKSGAQGKVDIFIDNVYQTTVDAYSSGWNAQQTLYSITGLPQGTHTFKAVKQSGSYLIVDAMKVYYGSNVIDDSSASIAYSGGTFSSSNQLANAINQTEHWTMTAGASAEYSFTGDSVKYFGSKNTDHGIVDIYIDGTPTTSVDTYGPTRQWHTELYAKTWPTSGPHKIKVVAKNQKNAASTSIGFDLDAFVYTCDPRETAMQPLWQGDTMNNESILMISANGQLPEAPLLFTPTKILSVKSARLDKEFVEGKDWEYVGGKLKLKAGTSIPYMNQADMYPATYVPNEAVGRPDGGYLIFREGPFFLNRQIVVTYTHATNVWSGPQPAFAGSTFTHTMAKLNNASPVKLVLYGDSISVGATASSYINSPPYLPNWGTLVAYKLGKNYNSSIHFVNPSVGGKMSDWGKDNAKTLVADQNPDLVIIAFGMNDGTPKFPDPALDPVTYKNNIQAIITKVRETNPQAEFILVGTTLPNPESNFLDKQPLYMAKLDEIAAANTGVVTANMTGIHQQLLMTKYFSDMTGNNVNHPNDFLSRWYAQFVSGLLIP
ncbi:LamG-like jellyroll fold domain-containing protein [Cohnella silvisoli]|nr:LamG-like jellyroll fold domain-containing protein [Cohnella silvisoli]